MPHRCSQLRKGPHSSAGRVRAVGPAAGQVLPYVLLTGLLLGLPLPGLAASAAAAAEPPTAAADTPAWRVPVDLAWHRERLFVANSRTGSLSMFTDDSSAVEREWQLAESLSSLAVLHDQLLLLDDRAHQLLRIRVEPRTGELQVQQTLPVAAWPVEIQTAPDQSQVAVSSLWSRRLTLLRPDTNQQLQVSHVVDLPFAPRCLQFLPGQLLAVADAFSGQVAIVSTQDGQVQKQVRVNGHNIRGLCLDYAGTALHVTLQTLSSETFISYERVFWGILMQNGLHTLPLDSLTGPAAAPAGGDSSSGYGPTASSSRSVYPLGTPSVGSGDPSQLVITRRDTTLLLLSGFNQVAFRTASHLPFSRLRTGQRPEAVCLNSDETRAFVANRYDDSITVVALTSEQPEVAATISLGPVRELTDVERGERLFHDAALSLDGWYSCHSCHTDGHTNGRLSDTLGDEGQGAPKKVLTLLGAGDTQPWAWNGSKPTIEQQIHTSLIISMQTQIPTAELPVAELTAYVRSLPPAPALLTARGQQLSEAQRTAGQRVFEAQGCASCHAGPTLTSAAVYDVGLQDETGGREFNPPSLRGVSQRAPYFHDGSAATLRDVLKSGHHSPDSPLTDEQLDALELLLQSL